MWGGGGFMACGMNSSPSDDARLFRVYINSLDRSQQDWPRDCLRKMETAFQVQE